jgi:hypothetical protein
MRNQVLEAVGKQQATIRSVAVGEAQRITQEELTTPQTGTYSNLTGMLRQNAPGQVEFVYAPSDSSALQLILAMRKAGWEVIKHPDGIVSNGPAGLILIDNPLNLSPSGLRLKSAFERSGLPLQINADLKRYGLNRLTPSTAILVTNPRKIGP